MSPQVERANVEVSTGHGLPRVARVDAAGRVHLGRPVPAAVQTKGETRCCQALHI